MKLKKPFFSRELIFNNLRRFWWVAVLYTIALFLVSPLIALTNGGYPVPKSGYNINFMTIYEGPMLFLLTVPVFIGVMVFRYMQNSKSMVTIHAMPYTRLRLYVNNIISGLILLLVPVLLNSLFLWIIKSGNFGDTYFREGIILRYLGISILTSITLYAWTIFVGMFTGSSIAQIIFTYILNFLLAGIVAVGQMLLGGVLYGFVMNEDICLRFLHISPLAQVMFLNSYTPEPGLGYFFVIDIIAIIVAFVIGYFVYKYRNLESAGDVISGKYVKPLFKYGVTVCTMLVGAVYVMEISSSDSVNVLVYLLFALIGYVVAEMLLRKSFKILDSYKGFLFFTIAFIIIAFGIKADLFGYEDYVPDAMGVKAVALNGNANFSESTRDNPEYGILYDSGNIENIIQLHNNIIDDKDINEARDFDNRSSVSISYQLIDGRVIKRAYDFEDGKYSKLLNEVFDSKEYKMCTNSIFDYNVEDIYTARISNYLLDNNLYVTIDNKEEIKELFEVMKTDILNSKTEDNEKYRNIYRVELTVKGKENDDEKTVQSRVSTIYIEDYVEDIESAEFLIEGFNIKSESIKSFIERKGYKDILQSSDKINSIKLRYNNSSDDTKLVTEKDKISNIMAALYNTSSPKYYRYKDSISVSINMDDNISWVEVDSSNADEIIKLFE